MRFAFFNAALCFEPSAVYAALLHELGGGGGGAAAAAQDATKLPVQLYGLAQGAADPGAPPDGLRSAGCRSHRTDNSRALAVTQ